MSVFPLPVCESVKNEVFLALFFCCFSVSIATVSNFALFLLSMRYNLLKHVPTVWCDQSPFHRYNLFGSKLGY